MPLVSKARFHCRPHQALGGGAVEQLTSNDIEISAPGPTRRACNAFVREIEKGLGFSSVEADRSHRSLSLRIMKS